MPELAVVRGHDSYAGAAPSVNFIVVPGIAGATLGDKTCPHLDDFLVTMITNCHKRARGWVYNNDIMLDKLESWDKYSSNGLDLLRQLLWMQNRPDFHEHSTLILIGHKLGCYILKKALFEAWNKVHKSDHRHLLDKIETVMMIGEPILDPRKRDHWIDSILECFPDKKALPRHLANGATVGSLHRISNDFEDIYLNSTVVDVESTTLKPRTKFLKVKNKNTGHYGCICPKTVYVCMWTTASKEQLVERGLGDISQCGFHPNSAHYQNLLNFNSKSILPTSPFEAEESIQASFSAAEEGPDQATLKSRAQHAEILSIPVITEASDDTLVQECEHGADDEFRTHDENGPTQPINDCLTSARLSNDAEDDEILREPGEMNAGSSAEVLPATLSTANESISSNGTGRRERKYNFTTWLPPRDKHFTGRHSILQQITEQVPMTSSDETSDRQVQSSKPKIVWLEGPGGIGKTSIAIEFAHRSVDGLSNLIFCDASSAASWGSSCHDSAVALGLVDGRTCQNHETSRQTLMSWLGALSEKWMLILDNVANDVNFIRRLPNSAQGLIIVTSRFPPLLSTESIALCHIQIPSWSQSEAEEFMFSLARRKHKQLDSGELRESAHRCHGIPLVLRQVANWYRRGQVTFKTLNRFLASAESELLTEREANSSLFLTAAISSLDANQTRLLGSLSFLKPEKITKRLADACLYSVVDDEGYEDTIAANSKQLWKLSLLDMDETETNFRMHSTTQSRVRNTLDDTAWSELFQAVVAGLDSQWPSQRKLKNIIQGFWDDFQSLHDHVHHLALSVIEKKTHNFEHSTIEPNAQFIDVLLKHSWYNGRRGNKLEDRLLHRLAARMCHEWPTPRSSTNGVPLPRRCLEIPKDPDQPIVLRDTEGTYGTYIACSLLWQDCQGATPELTSKSIKQYRERFDLSDLPPNLLQAIHVARGHEIPYVWVDLLCIKQDDPGELSEEVPRLTEYFSNSSITVYDTEDYFTGSFEITFHPCDFTDSFQKLLPESKPDGVVSGAIDHASSTQQSFDHKLDDTSLECSVVGPNEQTSQLSIQTEQSDLEGDTTEDIALRHRDKNHESKGWGFLEQGKAHLVAGSMEEAIGALTLSRDAFRVNDTLTHDEMDGYANASAMLSTAFRLLKMDTVALNIARNAARLCVELADLESSTCPGHELLLLSEGMALCSSAQLEQALERLKASRAGFAATGNGVTEWTASIDVQLASIHAASGDCRKAQELLQTSMNYFQAQPMSITIKGHVARILFRQSRLHQKENNTFMYNIIAAAASSALAELRPTSEKPSLENGSGTQEELTDKDFDALVEPWYR